MAGVAFLLKRRGHMVTGCDKYATPRTRWLERNDIPVAVGHSPSHLAGIDELVVTPAVPKDDPELAAAQGLSPQIRIRYRGEVLAEIVNASDGIAVCGTHGKTTTATFTARLLKALGTGLSEGISWKEVEILRSPEGAPVAALRGKAADRLHALGASRALVSISHDAGLAVAVAQVAR